MVLTRIGAELGVGEVEEAVFFSLPILLV